MVALKNWIDADENAEALPRSGPGATHPGPKSRVRDFFNYSLDCPGQPSQYSYDPWGERRDPTDWAGDPVSVGTGDASLSPRGFTDHEMLDDIGLIHMNGRIYDPLLGRMLSADIAIQAPNNLQSYNRYAYAINNPLTLKDEGGYFWSLAINIGFAVFDTVEFALGNQTKSEYAANMALTGAALVADVATGGQGGGLAVRALNTGVRAAKVIDKVNDVKEAVETGASVVQAAAEGDARTLVRVAVEQVAGKKAGEALGAIKKNNINTKKLDTVDSKTAPTAKADDANTGTKPSDTSKTEGDAPKATAIQHTKHSLDQKITREVKSSDELDAVRNPLKITDVKYDSQGRPSQKLIGEKATVTVNPNTGKAVTVHPTSSKLAERLKRELEGGRQ